MTQQVVIGYASAEVEMPPALRPFRPDGRVLKSELPGIYDEQWTDYAFAMKIANRGDISLSNGLGMFDIRYKRLEDLGFVTNISYKRDPIINRSVQVAEWLPPYTQDKFLKSANFQYRAFSASNRHYFKELRNRSLSMPPGVTFSGALAILHRGGRSALAKWATQQFDETREIFDMANGIF